MNKTTWSALGLLLACNGSDTGNPVLGGGGEEFAECEAKATTRLALGERGALGFAADDVLALVRGPASEALIWQPVRMGSYGPESGQGMLTLSATPVSDQARFVDYEQRQGGPEIAAECPDQLEVDVEVRMTTSGGALDETFRAVLTARSAEVARMFKRLDPDMLEGSLTADSGLGAQWTWEDLTLQLQATRHGLSGSLSNSFEMRTSDAVSNAPGAGPIATFGLAPCDQGTAVPLDVAAGPMLALLRQHETASVNTTTATVRFEPAGSACLITGADGAIGDPGLMVLGTLAFATADGVIDASWPVELRAAPDGSGPVSVKLDYRARLPEGDLAARYGLNVDLAGYDYGSAEVALTVAEAGWSGAILAYGFKRPMCPVAEPGDGDGTPGCPGSERTEVARFTVR